MKNLNIGQTIKGNRHLRGITQDELANYMGVSKASVSKWETGQTYPDITFLPLLAAYFDISIDELMGYEPQLTKEEIRQVYLKLSSDFAEKPFEEVITECQTLIKKYFSCYPLLLQIGILLFNNSNLPQEEKRRQEVITMAQSLFTKIKEESQEHDLIHQAINLEALTLLTLGDYLEVIDRLDESNPLVMSSEIILASAYQMTGKADQARQILQIQIYQYVLVLLQLLQSYMPLFFNDPEQFDEIAQRFNTIAEAFNLESLHPSILLPYYLTLAQGKMAVGDTDQALAALDHYTRIATGNIYPLKLKGDDFFTNIEQWMEDFPLGTNLPRDEKIVKGSMLEAVADNPIFADLKDTIRFENLILKLKTNL